MGGGWYINLGYFWGLICVWSIFPAFIQGTIKAALMRAMAMAHETGPYITFFARGGGQPGEKLSNILRDC